MLITSEDQRGPEGRTTIVVQGIQSHGARRSPPARRRERLPDGRVVTARLPTPPRSAEDIVQAFRSGALDASSLSGEEMKAFWTWCETKAAASLRRIDRHVSAGAHRQARRAMNRYTSSLYARALALKHSRPRRRQPPGMSWAQSELHRQSFNGEIFSLLNDAGRFDQAACGDVVHQRKKTRAGTRLVISFSWPDKARQRLLSAGLTPFASLHPSQFLLAQRPEGRGRTAACNALLRQMGDVTDDHVFMQIDIRDFYGSISHQWLEDHLPLGIETIRRHAHTGGMRLSIGSRVVALVRRTGKSKN